MIRAIVVVVMLVETARAQPGEPAPERPPVPAHVEPPGTALPDEAWSLYDEAFGDAARGDRDAAMEQLHVLQTRWPGHPAAQRAGSLLSELAPKPRRHRGSNLARGELVFWSTVGGALVAVNICEISGCDTARETALVYSSSIGGSLVLSLAASRDGVQPGEAQLYNSSQTWGSWNALAINDGFASGSDQAMVSLGAQTFGLGAGILLWGRAWTPTQGDIALTNSCFLWTSLLAVWAHVAGDAFDDGALRRIVVIGDLGIALGAALSTNVKMSRGRTLLIDVGGVLGTLAGSLVAIGTESEAAVGISLFIGTGAGLAIATLASREWDLPNAPAVTVAPARIVDPTGHGSWGAQLGFSF